MEVNGLRYNGEGLRDFRNKPSPFGGELAGKWPIRSNPDDVRHVYFQDLDNNWHRLDWEHAAALGTPFSLDAAQYVRRLAVAQHRLPNPAKALAELLSRWDKGMVTDRRERRMALRLSAERAALPLPDPTSSAPPRPPAPPPSQPPSIVDGDDDDEDEVLDTPDDDDFYADAFEVLE